MSAKDKCKKLYKENIWVRLFTYIRFWTGSFVEIEKFVPKRGTILDLGCGYGILTNYLALSSSERKIIGIDMDEQKIAHADKKIKNVSFSIGDATEMKLVDLDGIILHDVLHHLGSQKQQEKLIKGCFSMLKKKGILIIVEVDNKPWWKLVLGRLTDFLMYKGERVIYRYKKQMLELLRNYFSYNSVQIYTLTNNPFPQVLYICQKI